MLFLGQCVSPSFSGLRLWCLLCPSPNAANTFAHLRRISARIVIIDDQLQICQVGQAGEVADTVPIHVDHLQEGHAKQHRREVSELIAREPDGPELAQAPELTRQQT